MKLSHLFALGALAYVSLFNIAFAEEMPCSLISVNMGQKTWDSPASGQVSLLQRTLSSKGLLQNANITGYFGPLTFEAVKKYQASVGISPTGFVGPLTRAKINEENCSAVSASSNVGYSHSFLIQRGTSTDFILPVPWPYVNVVTPDGTEKFKAGDQMNIKWRSGNVPEGAYLGIFLVSSNASTSPVSVGSFSLPSKENSFDYVIPRIASGKYTIGLALYKDESKSNIIAKDQSDTFFTISE